MPDSVITKKAIAQGFKELMSEKSFDKITVADITKACGLNRQTFYYHFQDKYELLNWIYYNEVIVVMIKDLTIETWSQRLCQMLKVMEENDKFYQNAIKHSNSHEFQDYLFGIAKELFSDAIQKISKGKRLEDSICNFIAEFYSYGIVGLIVSWVQSGMKESPEEICKYMVDLVSDSQQFAVSRYLKEKHVLEL